MSTAQSKPRVRVPAGARHVEGASTLGVSMSRPARRAGDPFDQTLAGWHPGIGSADADWLGSRDTAIGRVRDIVQNEPWAQSGLDAKAVSSIGRGWIWSSRPSAKMLGMDPTSDEYKALANSCEVAFEEWATDPAFRGDHQRMLPYGLQLWLMALSLYRDGEALALVNYETTRTDGFKYKTTLQLIDPDRLSNPDNRPDDETYRGGIELDEDGRPLAVHIRREHPGDVNGFGFRAAEWDRYEMREAWGRPRVIHLVDRDRVDQHRGVSRMIAGLKRLKVLQSYSEAELKTAALNASVFATIYADGNSDYLAEALGDKAAINAHVDRQNAFYDASDPRFAGSRAIRTFPGDRVEMHTQGRNNAAFGEFTTVLLQSLAAGLGLTYEQLTKDFSRTNYSSARAAMIEAWRTVERERKLIQDLFADQVLLAVLEEAYDAGRLALPDDAPDFWDAPGAYIKGRWIAPERGAIDPVKERVGGRMAVGNFEKTYEDLAAEGGRDFDEVVASSVRVLKTLEAAELKPETIAAVLGLAHQTLDSSPEASPRTKAA